MDEQARLIGAAVAVVAVVWYLSRRSAAVVKLGDFDTPPEPYAPSEPVARCDPAPKPGAEAFRDWILSGYGGTDGGIKRPCFPGGAATSTHNEGRAWDWFPPDRATADRAIADLLAERDAPHELARRAGLRNIIYWGEIWNAGSAAASGDGWSRYKHADDPSDTLAHRDHVHFDFSWAGANAQTSLYARLGGRETEPNASQLVQSAAQLGRLGQPQTVSPTRTATTFHRLRSCLEVAHRNELGVCPSPARLRIAWAMVCHETDQTRSMWNHNVGNIAYTPGWPDRHALRVKDPSREPVWYRSYPSLEDGAADFWRLLAARYPEALAAFDDNDHDAAAWALKSRGYFGQDANAYGRALARHAAVYDRTFGGARS